VPSATKATGSTPPYFPGRAEKDDLPKVAVPLPAIPQPSEPTPTPSPTPNDCEQRESSTEITAQAAGLIALGVLAAGSVVALSVNAVRRRRS